MKSRRSFFKALLGIASAPKVIEAAPAIIRKTSQPGIFPTTLTLSAKQTAQLYDMQVNRIRRLYSYCAGKPIARRRS